jgi:hypothetical protein
MTTISAHQLYRATLFKQADEQPAFWDQLGDHAARSLDRIPKDAIWPARIAGGLGGVLVSAVIAQRLMSQLKKLKKTNPRAIKKLLHHFKLKDMPAVPYPKLDNAAYIEPHHFQKGWFSEGMHADDQHLKKLVAKNPKLVEGMRRHGLVIYDKKFATPAIMAHEAGHADIGNMPWYAPSNINQKYLRSLSDLVTPFAAPTVGLVTGAMTRNPFLGVGAGALTGALFGAPTLINEWQATHRANKYLDEKMLDEAERRKSKNTLGTAFNTYLAGATVPAAVAGGIAGAFASNANNKVY